MSGAEVEALTMACLWIVGALPDVEIDWPATIALWLLLGGRYALGA